MVSNLPMSPNANSQSTWSHHTNIAKPCSRAFIVAVIVVAVVALISVGIRRDGSRATVRASTSNNQRNSFAVAQSSKIKRIVPPPLSLTRPDRSTTMPATNTYSNTSDVSFEEVETLLGAAPVLHKVPLFNCLDNNHKSHDHVQWRTMSDEEAFGGRWQCFCLEQKPNDFNNCFSRFLNATIYRSYQSPETRERTIVLLDNVGFEVHDLRVDSSREPWTAHAVRLYTTKECRIEEQTHKVWVGNLSIPSCGSIYLNFSTTSPYNEPFTFTESPLLLIPVLTVQQNHYHSIAGPSGILQYMMSRNAINKYYFDREVARRNGLTNSLNGTDWYPPLIQGDESFFNKSYNRLNPASSRVDISNRGSCSIMNFSSADDGDAGWLLKDIVSPPITVQELINHRLPPTYLSREMLVGYDMADRVPKTLGTIGWFGRREGFCNLDLPHESYAVVKDLWVNLIGKHLTTQWLQRKKPYDLAALTDIVTAEEYLNFCALQDEETAAARWSVEQIISIWDKFKPPLTSPQSEVNALAERVCMSVNRPPGLDGKIDSLCVLAIGRKLSYDVTRTRGLPPNIENMIVTALVMPLSGLVPLSATPMEEMATSLWWGWDNETRSRRCETIIACASDGCPGEAEAIKALSPDTGTAKGALEQLNLNAGLRPCSTPGLSPGFFYDCVRFPSSSPYYNASKFRRADFGSMSVVEQFAQIRAANLFIFEEGAPLTWALAAKAGSTFICVFNSNFMRYEGDKGRWRTVRKEVKVDGRTEMIEELEPAHYNGGYSPQTEFFATMPHLLGKVRLIIVVYQYNRWPSMAKLREVYDFPFEAETYVVTCECDHTRIVPRRVLSNCSDTGRR